MVSMVFLNVSFVRMVYLSQALFIYVSLNTIPR